MKNRSVNGAYQAAYNQYPWGIYNLVQALLLSAVMGIVAMYAIVCELPWCIAIAVGMAFGVVLCLRSGVEAGVCWILWQRNGQVTISDNGFSIRTGWLHEVVVPWNNVVTVKWRRRSPYYRMRSADRFDVFQYTLTITFVDADGRRHIRDIMQCFANTPHANCVLVRDLTVRRAGLVEKNEPVVSATKSWWKKSIRLMNGSSEERLWFRQGDTSQTVGGDCDG